MPLPGDPLNGRCFVNAQLQLHLRSNEGPNLNSTFNALKGYVFKKEKGGKEGERRGGKKRGGREKLRYSFKNKKNNLGL